MRIVPLVVALMMSACSSGEAASTIPDAGTGAADTRVEARGPCDPTNACPAGYGCIYEANSCGGSGVCRELPDGATPNGQFVCDCAGRVQIASPSFVTIPFKRIATGFDDKCDAQGS